MERLENLVENRLDPVEFVKQLPSKKDRIEKYLKENICATEIIRALVCLCDTGNFDKKYICGLLISLSKDMKDMKRGFELISSDTVLNTIIGANIDEKTKLRMLAILSLSVVSEDIRALIDEKKYARIEFFVLMTTLVGESEK